MLGVLVAALTMALSAPAVAVAAVEIPAPTLTGTAGDNGWFTSEVTVRWAPSGATVSACGTQTLTADTTGTPVTCTASDDTSSVTRSITVHLDQTPPTAVAATASRPPDVGPSYTAPLPITWSATDPTSGIATCTSLTYTGPDGPAVAPTGTCRDRAGNVSAPLPFVLGYDTTAPVLPAPIVAATGAPTASQAAATGTPSPTAKAKPKAKRPTLSWRARPKVKYYNLQLFRNGHKILSAWPTVAHYTLQASWHYRGHLYKLAAGRYRWYVWPGYGPRAAHRYGRMVTKGAVTVPEP